MYQRELAELFGPTSEAVVTWCRKGRGLRGQAARFALYLALRQQLRIPLGR